MTTRVWYDIYSDASWMVQYTESDGRRTVVLPGGAYKTLERNELMPTEARVQLYKPQELLDALLAAGVRPSSSEWSVGHVEALEHHVAFAEKVATALLERKA